MWRWVLSAFCFEGGMVCLEMCGMLCAGVCAMRCRKLAGAGAGEWCVGAVSCSQTGCHVVCL